MALLPPLKLSEQEKLEALQQLDRFRKWRSLDEKRYCAEHPRSPAALRRPQLSVRGRTVIALLGVTIEGGIAGFGDNVGAALRAFDAQYQRMLRPSPDCP